MKQLKIDAIAIYDDVTFCATSRKAPIMPTSTENLFKTSENRNFARIPIEIIGSLTKESLASDFRLEDFELNYFNNYTVRYIYNNDHKAYERYINGKFTLIG